MPRLLFLPAAGIVTALALVCSACYTLKQGAQFLSYLNRAVPLERLTGEEAFVAEVNRIRDFAMGELGLKQSRNYTRYVAIDRSYLAAIVSACDPLSFKRHTWWFPVIGSVPYKGFFNPADARKERDALLEKDLDVWIRPVDAFSTLGFFRDPLYSYMKDYAPHRLADLIIHELTHATIYRKNDANFNEGLAEFVGREGARLYIETYYGAESAEFAAIDAGNADSKTYITFLQSLIKDLETVYASGIPADEKRTRKAETIAAAQQDFSARYDELFQHDNYRGFAEMTVNNAYLDLYRLYNDGDGYFESVYESCGRDIRRFIASFLEIK